MDPSRKTTWFSWARLAGLAVTAGLFYFIFQKIDGRLLWETFQRTNPWGALTAFLAYGVALVLGGMRWHLALRLTDRTVHSGASCRLMFIGHFFYVALFGAAGGDIAKSTFYSRWFRYPLPEVVAAAPLDRGLGAVGVVAVASSGLVLSLFSGGFHHLSSMPWEWRSTMWFFVAGAVILTIPAVILWKPQRETVWSRALNTLKLGICNLVNTPVLGAKALLCSVVHQIATMAVFGLCLLAVSSEPVPWLQLAWTIPAVTILSCFPISIAGAGVREVVAITLLGWYHVPPGDSVAAAMLTLVIKLIWSAVGGGIFWREQRLQSGATNRAIPQTISLVIPTYNEVDALPETLSRLGSIPEIHEIIVVDGGSSDGTIALAKEHGCRVLASCSGRGGQLRWGAAHATGDVVLMVHADTWLPADAGRALLNALRDSTVVGGGYWKMFRRPPLLLQGSRLKCAVRLWGWNRIAGDQALFVRRDVLESIGGIPDMPLMEEFALCDRLKRIGRLALAGANIETSARRFRKHGPARTYLLMGWIHLLYRLGYPPEDLKRIYEGGRVALPHKKPVGVRS